MWHHWTRSKTIVIHLVSRSLCHHGLNTSYVLASLMGVSMVACSWSLFRIYLREDEAIIKMAGVWCRFHEIFGAAFITYSWKLWVNKVSMSHAYFMCVRIHIPCPGFWLTRPLPIKCVCILCSFPSFIMHSRLVHKLFELEGERAWYTLRVNALPFPWQLIMFL